MRDSFLKKKLTFTMNLLSESDESITTRQDVAVEAVVGRNSVSTDSCGSWGYWNEYMERARQSWWVQNGGTVRTGAKRRDPSAGGAKRNCTTRTG